MDRANEGLATATDQVGSLLPLAREATESLGDVTTAADQVPFIDVTEEADTG